MSKHCIGIIGTDTDVGKTLVTALIGKLLKIKKKEPLLIKALQTGCYHTINEDVLIVPDIEKYKDVDESLLTDSCYHFIPACSPHLALEKEGKSLSALTLAKDILQKIENSKQEIVLLEGAGGLMTPLNAKESFADVFSLLAKTVNFSLILVIGNKLGALNHALLTYEKIKSLDIPLLGFITIETSARNINNDLEIQIKSNNIEYVKQYFPCEYLGALPYNENIHSADKEIRQGAYNELTTYINIEKSIKI